LRDTEKHTCMNLCVIPARGGSKRIPRKNIRPFCGKPMISWSIQAAIASELFDKIIVSTDDDEIADVARSHGAEAPFRRPAELSDDHAGTTAVIAHAANWATQEVGWELQSVCCLYATAPFVQPADLQQGLRLLNIGKWEFCFTATSYASPIFRAFQTVDNGGIAMFFPQHFDTRSQDLPAAFHDAGQFYWGTPNAWIQRLKIFDRHSTPLFIPRWCVQDIDDEADWFRAELLWKALRTT
jgi:pseudaminic acid cytidylyltransferase